MYMSNATIMTLFNVTKLRTEIHDIPSAGIDWIIYITCRDIMGQQTDTTITFCLKRGAEITGPTELTSSAQPEDAIPSHRASGNSIDDDPYEKYDEEIKTTLCPGCSTPVNFLRLAKLEMGAIWHDKCLNRYHADLDTTFGPKTNQ